MFLKIYYKNLICFSEAMIWMRNPNNFELLKASFDSSSRFARLSKLHVKIAGRYLFIRFVAKTGDAMGMNMLSKVSTYLLVFTLIFTSQIA